MDNIDIPTLTKEAESGNGCSIKEKIQAMPFEESLKTLKAIQDQNKVDRDADSSIPKVLMEIGTENKSVRLSLRQIAGAWSLPDTIVTDKLSFKNYTGTRSQSCSEKD